LWIKNKIYYTMKIPLFLYSKAKGHNIPDMYYVYKNEWKKIANSIVYNISVQFIWIHET